MMSGESYSCRPNYPQPYNIRISPDLVFPNSAVEEHMILKGHVAAKHEAKQRMRQQQEKYYQDLD
jgi:hypothetical protein